MVVPIEQRVIPHSAQIFGRLVQCSEMDNMHSVDNLRFAGGKGTPWRDKDSPQCSGGWPANLSTGSVSKRCNAKFMSEEAPLLSFGCSGLSDQEVVSVATDITATETGTMSGLLLYWRLDLLSPEVDPQRALLHYQAWWTRGALARPLGAVRVPVQQPPRRCRPDYDCDQLSQSYEHLVRWKRPLSPASKDKKS